ncbi:MAG: hypothetical protein ABL900_11860 [Burkholderiaceae bacterium]
MSFRRGSPGRRVPTLTEVISPPTGVDLLLDVPGGLPDIDFSSFAAGVVADTLPFTKSTVPSISALLAGVENAPAPGDGPSARERVLAEVTRELDAVLEAQLRDVLVPLLQQAAEAAIRETRERLRATLQEVVEQAVAQELARHPTDELPRSG